MSDFIYIIRHNPDKKPIIVPDLNPPRGWISPPPINTNDENSRYRYMHLIFTKEQIDNSKCLKQAIASGWFSIVDDGANATEMGQLKNQISQLANLVTQFAQQQTGTVQFMQPLAAQTIDNEVLNTILNEVQQIKKKTVGVSVEGYNQLTPESAALIAREKSEVTKITGIKTNKKEVDSGSDDLTKILDTLL
jgi:hypothetical protein